MNFIPMIIGAAFVIGAGPSDKTDSLLAELQREAIPEWDRLDQLMQGKSIEIKRVLHFRKFDAEGKPLIDQKAISRMDETLLVKTDRICSVQSKTNGSPDSKTSELPTRVEGFNPRYGFTLIQMPENKPNFLLRNFEQEPGTIVSNLKSIIPSYYYAWRANGIRLDSMWSADGWKLLSLAEKSSSDGRRIVIDCQHEELQQGKTIRIEYRVAVNPDRNWRIEEYDFYADGAREETARFAYDNSKNESIPCPSRIEFASHYLINMVPPRTAITLEIVAFHAKEIADREFTLSAFGLPEPIGQAIPRRTPNYVWLLVFAGLFLVLGMAIRYFIRRRPVAST